MSKPWRYRTHEELVFHSPHLVGVRPFKNEWIEMDGQGRLIIAKDYAWDGMSPTKYIRRWNYWLGPYQGGPDPVHKHLPYTWRASLVHDAFCQFRYEVPLKQSATVHIFEDMLKECGFPLVLREAYVLAVDQFGPQEFGGDLLFG